MALIKLGSVVTRISGKIGGQTFGESASGAYIKNSGTPRKSITLSQRSKMSAMATTAQQWRALTQAQRDTFNAASPDYPYLNRVGETKFYSGYAIFTKLRNNGLNVGFSGIPVPLPKVTFNPITGSQVFIAGGNIQGSIISSQTGIMYRFFMSKISSMGISNPYKNQFFIGEVLGDGNDVLEALTASYVNRFGPLPASGKFYYSISAISVSTGQSLKNLVEGLWSF